MQDGQTCFYETERLALLLPQEGLSREVTDFYLRNRDTFRETEPNREERYYTEAFQRSVLCGDAERFRNGTAAKFWICKKGESRIIGRVALNEIIRFDFQSAFLSYQMDQDEQNKGYMTEAVGKCVAIAFQEWNLHRLEANIMPRNAASRRVAEKCGFVQEGFSKAYMRVNGVWEDHIHFVRLNEETNWHYMDFLKFEVVSAEMTDQKYISTEIYFS